MGNYKRAGSLCRNCYHTFYNHCLYTEIKQGGNLLDFINVLEIVPCNFYMSDGKLCSCIKWEPNDNLEWLKLKAKEKESGS